VRRFRGRGNKVSAASAAAWLRATPLARLLATSRLGRGLVTVQPCTALTVEVSGGQPNYLSATALACEAVLVFMAARQHLCDPADLSVQSPGCPTFHAFPRVAPRSSGESDGPRASGPPDCCCEPSPQSGSLRESWLARRCFSYRWIGGSSRRFTGTSAIAAGLPDASALVEARRRVA